MEFEDRAIIQQYRSDLETEIRHRTFVNRTKSQRDFGPLARWAEYWCQRKIEALGYHTALTARNFPFDLWAWDDQGNAARIEVKFSLYFPFYRGGGRFQAHIRNHQHDLVIFIARNGRDWPFVIPAKAVPPKNLTIWSACPGDSKPWKPYLEAWDHLHQAIASHRPVGWQLPLSQ